MRPPCPLCGGADTEFVTDRLRRGSGVVYRCGGCDHGFLLTDRVLDERAYYDEGYRKDHSHKASGSETNPREVFDIYVRFQEDRLRVMAGDLSGSVRLLEVGASAGQFLHHARTRVASVDAIELNVACCDFMRAELDIQAEPTFLAESSHADGCFDVVCAFQVMEHVPDPVQFLADLRAATAPGGVVFVEVPNLHDPLLSVWDVEGYHDFYYHDAHLHYFSADSVRRAAVAAGFSPNSLEVHFIQDYNLLNHLHWVTLGAPQPTCEVGLSPVVLDGADEEFAAWLSTELDRLDGAYRDRLAASGRTSNLMLVARRGS